MSVRDEITGLCASARRASRSLARENRAIKDAALAAAARRIRADKSAILAANAADLADAREHGTRGALLDRLALDDARVGALADAVEFVASLPDPTGAVLSRETRPNGLLVSRVSVPIGVICMIYEARPNVTAEASALALKSGNAIVLRGGHEALRSNVAIVDAVRAALDETGLPRDAVTLVTHTDREVIRALVQMVESVDLVIPRGGEALIRFVTENARVPVVQHYKGVCHMYIDAGADAELAARLAVNAKMSRPGVCNALECLLVDVADATRVLPVVARGLLTAGCELRGCARTRAIVREAKAASDDDWGREFLDAILAVRIVEGLDGALDHIARFGSGHTEAIVTPDAARAERWRREVDAACVVVNASTRFHDGAELGLGAEIGIATSRLHWRGPMGLQALTTHKWVVDGAGHVRG